MSDKRKIGIFGSSAGDMKATMPKAVELGKALSGYADQLILITGACPGLPYAVIAEAASSGVEIWRFSSSLDAAAQKQAYPDDDLSMYSKMIYVPRDFPFANNDRACKKYRNVISTTTCDAAIVISGRWGSLNEFTNLVDLQKTIGVLTGTGGIADELPALSRNISKAGQGQILFEPHPGVLVKKLLHTLTVIAKP